MAGWRAAAERVGDSLRRGARRPSAVRGVHRARGLGLRRDEGGPVSADAALPVLRSLPQAGREAARPRAGDAAVRRSLLRRNSGRATSNTTNASPCATRRSRHASRPSLRPTPAICAWRSTTRPRRRSWTSTTCTATPRDGLHMASLAGTWIAFVDGLWRHARSRRIAGVRSAAARHAGAPGLFDPSSRAAVLHVDVTRGSATYTVTRGTESVRIVHHGVEHVVRGEPIVCSIPSAPHRSAPTQPVGREPRHRQPAPERSSTRRRARDRMRSRAPTS